MRLINAEPIERGIIREVGKIWLKVLLKGKENRLNITIVMVDGIEDAKAYTIKTGTKSYSISLEKQFHLSYKLQILAHELVHIKQYVTGQLRDNHDGSIVYWKSKPYKNDDNFWKQPWELEAVRHEAILYRHLIRYCDKQKINIIARSARKRATRHK